MDAPLPRVSRNSHLSANGKRDNEVGIVPRSSGIYLAVEENLSYETVNEDYATSHRLKWGTRPPNEVGRIAQHDRKREGTKEGNPL